MLYRTLIFACVVALLLAAFASAQRKERGPRALAVLETVDGRERLVPVSVFDNGKFYDGELYLARPRPLAVDPGTVYELQRGGEPQGLFTVDDAEQVKTSWIGIGHRQSATPAPSEVSAPGAKPSPAPDDDAPPVLRRPGSAGAAKPAENSKSEPPPAAPAPKPAPREEDDPNRPVLRRGKPAARPEESLPKPLAPKPGAPVISPGMAGELVVAVSDAAAPEARPFNYVLKPEEQQRYTLELEAFASAEVNRYAAARPGLKPETLAPTQPPPSTRARTARRPAPAPSQQQARVRFQDVRVRTFDTNLNGEPVLVFSARVPAAATAASANPPAFLVTVVGRLDAYDKMRTLYSAVTDTTRLDARPRMDLVDAVDADGDRRGELLFRQVYESGSAFALYRVGRDGLVELFEGAQTGR